MKGSTVNKMTTCKSVKPYRRNFLKLVFVYDALIFMFTCHIAGTNLQCFASLEFGFLSLSVN